MGVSGSRPSSGSGVSPLFSIVPSPAATSLPFLYHVKVSVPRPSAVMPMPAGNSVLSIVPASSLAQASGYTSAGWAVMEMLVVLRCTTTVAVDDFSKARSLLPAPLRSLLSPLQVEPAAAVITQ